MQVDKRTTSVCDACSEALTNNGEWAGSEMLTIDDAWSGSESLLLACLAPKLQPDVGMQSRALSPKQLFLAQLQRCPPQLYMQRMYV